MSPITVAFADEVEQQVKDDMISVCKKFGVSIDESQVFDILQGGEHTYNEGYKAGLNDLINILNSEKGSRVAGEALYYLSLDWINKNFKYEQDHLHPYDRFDGSKPVSVTMDTWRKWRGNRNRLPNLQLLEGRCNGSKNDMPLMEYYNDMNNEQKAKFRKEAFIPDNIGLELEHFEEFYEKRKELLATKLKELLG